MSVRADDQLIGPITMVNKPNDHDSSSPQAKWAVIIDDRLVPMPRRRMKARDILHQSGVDPACILVRDYNSPNDIGFDPDAFVDLAEGNVFRTEIACTCSHEVRCSEPPKRAFVVDDRWEITIQPHQTGATLRRLLNISEGVEVQRDYESPNDLLIGNHDKLEFADGPVFTTSRRAIRIVVEATEHEWLRRSISYTEVVTLFDPEYPQHPEITYSVTYNRGPAEKPEGILSPGATVKVINCMVFNVSPTGQS